MESIEKFCGKLESIGCKIMDTILKHEGINIEGAGIVVKSQDYFMEYICDVSSVTFDDGGCLGEHTIRIHPFPQKCIDGTECENQLYNRYHLLNKKIKIDFPSQFILVLLHEIGHIIQLEKFREKSGTLEEYMQENYTSYMYDNFNSPDDVNMLSIKEIYAEYIACKYYADIKEYFYDKVYYLYTTIDQTLYKKSIVKTNVSK